MTGMGKITKRLMVEVWYLTHESGTKFHEVVYVSDQSANDAVVCKTHGKIGVPVMGGTLEGNIRHIEDQAKQFLLSKVKKSSGYIVDKQYATHVEVYDDGSIEFPRDQDAPYQEAVVKALQTSLKFCDPMVTLTGLGRPLYVPTRDSKVRATRIIKDDFAIKKAPEPAKEIYKAEDWGTW